jgi:hypothetical protein
LQPLLFEVFFDDDSHYGVLAGGERRTLVMIRRMFPFVRLWRIVLSTKDVNRAFSIHREHVVAYDVYGVSKPSPERAGRGLEDASDVPFDVSRRARVLDNRSV